MGLQTAGLCYAQPLNNGLFTACEYFFRRTLSVTPLRNLSANKRLRHCGLIPFIANSPSMYTKSDCAKILGHFEEISAYFLVQLSSRSHFAKIENKKVIAENQCEKHKN